MNHDEANYDTDELSSAKKTDVRHVHSQHDRKLNSRNSPPFVPTSVQTTVQRRQAQRL